MSQQELERLCREWQKRLRLQDWKIRVRFARYYEMDSPEHWGECEWNGDHRIGDIKLLDPNDAQPGGVIEYDVEETLVHELLHLHVASFAANIERGSYQCRAMEQAIDAIEQALVTLKRRAANTLIYLPSDSEDDGGTTDPE